MEYLNHDPVTEEEEVERITNMNCEFERRMSEKYPSVEVEVQYGGQPIYYYILSVE